MPCQPSLIVVLLALAAPAMAADAIPAGPLKRLLHLGASHGDAITGRPTSGQHIFYDEFLWAGRGFEWLQQPAAGQAVAFPVDTTTSPLVWTVLDDADGTWGDDTAPNESVSYYAVWFEAASPVELRLAYSADHALRVHLDGDATPVIEQVVPGSGTTATLALAGGRHRLLIKHFDHAGGSGFSLRFTDPSGADLTGLTAHSEDTLPPTVAIERPTGNAVHVGEDVQLAFSEPMDDSVAATEVASIAPDVAGTWTWQDGFRLCFVPTTRLAPGTAYTVFIAHASARDRAGNPLAGADSFTFATASAAPPPVPSAVATPLPRADAVPLVITGSGFALGPIPRPPGASAHAGHFYRFARELRNWQDATTVAEALGGHLATPTTSAEDDFCWKLGGQTHAWIGLHDRDRDGIWTWVTGEPLAWTSWAPGEPNDWLGGDEDAAIYWYGLGWNDAPSSADSHRPALMEFDRPATPRVRLLRDGAIIVADEVALTGDSLSCTVDLESAARGAWDLEVTNPDGQVGLLAGAVTIANQPPVVVGQTIGPAAAGVPLTGQLVASDADGDALTFRLATAPTRGTAIVAADGSFSYTADAATTSDSFTVIANDGLADSAPATVVVAGTLVVAEGITVRLEGRVRADVVALRVAGQVVPVGPGGVWAATIAVGNGRSEVRTVAITRPTGG